MFEGHSGAGIAAHCGCGLRTAAFHVSNILLKCDAINRTAACYEALRRGWLEAPALYADGEEARVDAVLVRIRATVDRLKGADV
jgi:hypothetical protein